MRFWTMESFSKLFGEDQNPRTLYEKSIAREMAMRQAEDRELSSVLSRSN